MSRNEVHYILIVEKCTYSKVCPLYQDSPTCNNELVSARYCGKCRELNNI
jgi:hypothetical protein